MAEKTALEIINDLEAQAKVNEDVEDSAAIVINGFAGRLQAGIDAALAGGATKDQVAPLQATADALKAKSDALAAAVAANTA